MKTVLCFTTLLLSLTVFAQSNNYYYYNGKKVFLDVDRSVVKIVTTSSFSIDDISDIGFSDIELKATRN